MNDAKKVTVKAAFKKIYGAALNPLGFVWAKTKEPCFIRVINDELIHILGINDKKPYYVVPFGGVATLYRANLLLDKTYRDMSNWLPMASLYWQRMQTDSDELPKLKFDYMIHSPESIQNAVQAALAESQRLILPVIDNVRLLQDFPTYYQKIHNVNHMWIPSLPLKKHGTGNFLEDQVICYLLNDLVSYAEQIISKAEADMQAKIDTYSESSIPDNLRYLKERNSARHRAVLESVHSFAENPEVHRQTLDELERRRQMNLEILHSYGVL